MKAMKRTQNRLQQTTGSKAASPVLETMAFAALKRKREVVLCAVQVQSTDKERRCALIEMGSLVLHMFALGFVFLQENKADCSSIGQGL
jgi:hypothetical protein